MFEILPESTGNCIGFKVSGKVTAEDYDRLLPVLDKAIADHGRIDLLVHFGDMEGWEGLEAAKADFDFGRRQYRRVEKAAFVGDKKWQKWVIQLMDPFTRRTTERFYDSAHLQEAWQWVKDD